MKSNYLRGTTTCVLAIMQAQTMSSGGDNVISTGTGSWVNGVR